MLPLAQALCGGRVCREPGSPQWWALKTRLCPLCRFFQGKQYKPVTLLTHTGNVGIHFPRYQLPVVHQDLSRDF